jgi:hypothetical protein
MEFLPFYGTSSAREMKAVFPLFVTCMSLFGRQPKVVVRPYRQEILG